MRAQIVSPHFATVGAQAALRRQLKLGEVLGLEDGDRDVVDHQVASRAKAAALEDAPEDLAGSQH